MKVKSAFSKCSTRNLDLFLFVLPERCSHFRTRVGSAKIAYFLVSNPSPSAAEQSFAVSLVLLLSPTTKKPSFSARRRTGNAHFFSPSRSH